MTRTEPLRSLVTASVAALAYVAPMSFAAAQTAVGGTGTLEEIIVSAQRRAEALQDVPIAATALSGDDLRQASVHDIRDLSLQVPSLVIDTPFGNNSPKISLRGIGSGSFNQNTESTVALYLDELVLNPTPARLSQLFDVERLEVLRGPQGTLYGKNSTGGAINMITRRPNGREERFVAVTLGRWGEAGLEVAAETPLSEATSARASFKGRYRDGYGRNLLTGEDVEDNDELAARIGVRHRGAKADVYAKAFADRSRSDGHYTKTIGVNTDSTPRPDRSNPLTDYITPEDPYTAHWNPQRSHVDNLGIALNVDYELGSHTLSSVTGYLKSRADVSQDCDGSPFVLCSLDPFGTDARQFSQELRVTSPGGGRFEWIAGLNLFHQDLELRNTYRLTDLGVPPIPVAIDETTLSYAAFLDGSFEITEALTAFGGARLTHDRKEFSHAADFSLIGPFDYRDERSWTEPTWRAGVKYRMSRGALVYASYNRGYRSGAYDTGFVTTPEQFTAANPEFVDSYELGAKFTAFDARLQIAAAAYLSKFSDQQLLIVRDVPDSLCCSLVNAGKADIKGVEVEATALLADWLTLRVSGTAADAEYEQFRSGGLDFSGERLPGIPDYQLTVAPEFRLGAADGEFFFGPEVVLNGEIRRSTNIDLLGRDIQDAYTIVNARVGYRTLDDRLQVVLSGRNLTDRLYLTDWLDLSTFGFIQEFYGEPRSWSLTASYRW